MMKEGIQGLYPTCEDNRPRLRTDVREAQAATEFKMIELKQVQCTIFHVNKSALCDVRAEFKKEVIRREGATPTNSDFLIRTGQVLEKTGIRLGTRRSGILPLSPASAAGSHSHSYRTDSVPFRMPPGSRNLKYKQAPAVFDRGSALATKAVLLCVLQLRLKPFSSKRQQLH